MKLRSVWRYPVKSLLGEALREAAIDTRGVSGDRIFALADTRGKLGSGKSTNRFQRIDNLLSLRASTHGDDVQITMPDGWQAAVGTPELPLRLSDFLSQPVTIVKEENVPHFDDGAVHILLSSELKKLQALFPHLDFDPRRFRANLLLDTPDHVTAVDLVGRVLTIGAVRLKVPHPTERCVLVTAKQDGLASEPMILKAISQGFEVNFGVYASVLKLGQIEVGQEAVVSATVGAGTSSGRQKFGF